MYCSINIRSSRRQLLTLDNIIFMHVFKINAYHPSCVVWRSFWARRSSHSFAFGSWTRTVCRFLSAEGSRLRSSWLSLSTSQTFQDPYGPLVLSHRESPYRVFSRELLSTRPQKWSFLFACSAYFHSRVMKSIWYFVPLSKFLDGCLASFETSVLAMVRYYCSWKPTHVSFSCTSIGWRGLIIWYRKGS